MFLAWGPVTLLLTSCYSRLTTTELNAPLKQTRPSRFEDLICRSGHLLKLPAKDGIAQVKKTVEFDRHRSYYLGCGLPHSSEWVVQLRLEITRCKIICSAPFLQISI